MPGWHCAWRTRASASPRTSSRRSSSRSSRWAARSAAPAKERGSAWRSAGISRAAWAGIGAGAWRLARFGAVPALASGLELAGFAILIALSTELGDLTAHAFQIVFSIHNVTFGVALGLGSAAVLYGIFQAGDRLARRILPGGGREIGDIYALRSLGPAGEIGLRLASVIGPAEELFWRGYLQRRIGWLPASAAYGGAHLVTGNVTLIGAAAVAGMYWGLLRAIGMSMPALITSHIAWDVWIFLLAPTEGASEGIDSDAMA